MAIWYHFGVCDTGVVPNCCKTVNTSVVKPFHEQTASELPARDIDGGLENSRHSYLLCLQLPQL